MSRSVSFHFCSAVFEYHLFVVRSVHDFKASRSNRRQFPSPLDNVCFQGLPVVGVHIIPRTSLRDHLLVRDDHCFVYVCAPPPPVCQSIIWVVSNSKMRADNQCLINRLKIFILLICIPPKLRLPGPKCQTSSSAPHQQAVRGTCTLGYPRPSLVDIDPQRSFVHICTHRSHDDHITVNLSYKSSTIANLTFSRRSNFAYPKSQIFGVQSLVKRTFRGERSR
jgi:hypothetical protein